MPRKIKKIKQKQKQKQSQKVVVNINTTKRSSNRKQQQSKSNLPSNNNKVPSVIVNMPSYNHPNNPINTPVANPINNELLRILRQHREPNPLHNTLLNSIEIQTDQPQNAMISNTETQTEPTKIRDMKIQTETIKNKIKTSQTDQPHNALLSNIETQTDETQEEENVLDTLTNDSGSYNENELLPFAKKVDYEPISVDEAKPIATNSAEANRMVKEQSKLNKEKAYEEYKSIGGFLPFTKDLHTKTIIKNIAAINERNKLLSDNNTTKDDYRKFLTKNDVSGVSKLNKDQLIERAKKLTL